MEIIALSVVAILTQWVWPIFLFIFGLGAVVFVHELGHFLVAKAVGIKVERFAIGFGPRVCGYRGKETDYSLMLLPLGGYVKMLGQEDFAPLEEDAEPDPRAYSSKSVGARFAVIAAGVTMNVIFAAIMFVIIGMVGMPVPAPVIGATVPGSPANTAEITWLDDSGQPMDARIPGYPADQPRTLQPGDRMKTIDGEGLLISLLGRDITRFRRVLMQAVLSDVTDRYTLVIERTIGDKVLTGRINLGLKMSPSPSGTGSKLPSFGIVPASSIILGRGEGYVPDESDLFRNRDKVVAIDGRKTEHNWEIEKIQRTLGWRPVKVTLERTVDGKTARVDIPSVEPTIRSNKVFYLKDGEILRGKVIDVDDKKKIITLRVTVEGELVPRDVSIDNLTNTHYSETRGLSKELLDVLGMIPRLRVSAVVEGSLAHDAGLEAGDIIVRYGNHTAPTHLKLMELNQRFAANGADITVMRDGKVLSPFKIKPRIHRKTAVIGIVVDADMDHLVVAGVRKNSPAFDLDITSGDVVERINGQDIGSWRDLLAALSKLQGKDVALTMKRGENRSEKTICALSTVIFDESDYTRSVVHEPWAYRRLMDPKVSRGPVAALAWGARETMFFVTTSYATLRSLINRTVSTKELSGPVGIGSMAIQAGRRSMLDFAYFMAIISVSLAVVNFLPFPVVDGGHAMFLIIEKIRGKPLSIRIMNVVQLIGLAMILMVFVFVTWQDISKLWGG